MSDQFWNSAQMEPKRNYKFVLYIKGVKHWIVKGVKRPSYSVTETSHKYLNHTFWYPAHVEWDPSDVTLVDPIAHNAAGLMRDKITEAGYKWVDPDHVISSTDLSTISKNNSTKALGQVKIEQIDSDSNVIDVWELHNAWISKVDMSELSYESEDLSEITLTLRFDYATLSTR